MATSVCRFPVARVAFHEAYDANTGDKGMENKLVSSDGARESGSSEDAGTHGGDDGPGGENYIGYGDRGTYGDPDDGDPAAGTASTVTLKQAQP